MASYTSGLSNGKWSLILTPKQATQVLFFNVTVVKKVNEHKHLGFILGSGLSFKKHLDEKIIKVKKNVGIIKHLSKFLLLKNLDQMYKALVRSHLDYCDIITFHQQFTHLLNFRHLTPKWEK